MSGLPCMSPGKMVLTFQYRSAHKPDSHLFLLTLQLNTTSTPQQTGVRAVDIPALSAHLGREGHPRLAAQSCGWASLGRGWPGTLSAHTVQNSALPWGRVHSGSLPVVFQDRLGVVLSLFGAWQGCKRKGNLRTHLYTLFPKRIHTCQHTTQSKAHSIV